MYNLESAAKYGGLFLISTYFVARVVCKINVIEDSGLWDTYVWYIARGIISYCAGTMLFYLPKFEAQEEKITRSVVFSFTLIALLLLFSDLKVVSNLGFILLSIGIIYINNNDHPCVLVANSIFAFFGRIIFELFVVHILIYSLIPSIYGSFNAYVLFIGCYSSSIIIAALVKKIEDLIKVKTLQLRPSYMDGGVRNRLIPLIPLIITVAVISVGISFFVNSAKYNQVSIEQIEEKQITSNIDSGREDVSISFDGKEIVVAQDGTGDFITINSALDCSKEGDNIIIRLMPGTYKEIVDEKARGLESLTIIGSDKKECIIESDTGRYKDAPLMLNGNFFVENITVRMTLDSVGSWYPTYDGSNVADSYPGYAVHIDSPSFDSDREAHGIIKDCHIYSEAFPAVGMGLRNCQTVEFEDCSIERKIIDDTFMNENAQGAFVVHSSNNESDKNYRLVLINNKISINKGYALHIRGELGNKSEFQYLTLNNNIYSDELGMESCVIWGLEEQRNPLSHGNTASNLN